MADKSMPLLVLNPALFPADELSALKARGAAASGEFSWRVVAKRKDLPAPRFEVVTVPPEPMLPPIPDMSSVTPPLSRSVHD